jgi:small conductance mechanosensitive channel
MENEQINQFIDAYMGTVINVGMNVIYAFVILIASIWISGVVRSRIIAIALKHEEIDDTLFTFVGSLVRYGILALSGVAILGVFGLQTTSLVALMGAAGLAVGLALQGTLSNLAAGVMLIMFRPFKLGDYITAGGESGTVKAISLFTTELATPDNVQVIVPNGSIWGGSVTNFSYYETRRAEWSFGVSYGSNLADAEKIIREVIMADPRAKADPALFIQVATLGDFSVDFLVRAWCDRGDLFAFKTDMTRKVKEALDAGGIDIPFPTQTLIQS